MRYQSTAVLHKDPLSSLPEPFFFYPIAMYIEHQSVEKKLSVFEEFLKHKNLDVFTKVWRAHLEGKKITQNFPPYFLAITHPWALGAPTILEIALLNSPDNTYCTVHAPRCTNWTQKEDGQTGLSMGRQTAWSVPAVKSQSCKKENMACKGHAAPAGIKALMKWKHIWPLFTRKHCSLQPKIKFQIKQLKKHDFSSQFILSKFPLFCSTILNTQTDIPCIVPLVFMHWIYWRTRLLNW